MTNPTPNAHSESRQGGLAHSATPKASGSQSDTSCVFCERIKNGEYDDSFADHVIFEPLNPVTPGHMLVVPINHLADLNDSEGDAKHDMSQTGWALRYFTNDLDSYNIITSKGVEATQTIQHLHFHIVPRTKDDSLLLPWSDVATQVNEARIDELEELQTYYDYLLPKVIKKRIKELIKELQSLQTRGST